MKINQILISSCNRNSSVPILTLLCPSRVLTHSPVSAFQTRTVLRSDPVMIYPVRGSTQTVVTPYKIQIKKNISKINQLIINISMKINQILISSYNRKSSVPILTSLCPSRVLTHSPVSAFQIRTVLSNDPLMRYPVVGSTHTALTRYEIQTTN